MHTAAGTELWRFHRAGSPFPNGVPLDCHRPPHDAGAAAGPSSTRPRQPHLLGGSHLGGYLYVG
ncbi:hypothetical protein GFS60_06522 (plasmid) [Rhodococcus sp. WAY2]|nr:hypothetical protein GFS60_06522 [Rhodococcus sp. WAY2]